jgi:hypothetical protein
VPDEAKATFKYVGQWIGNLFDLAFAKWVAGCFIFPTADPRDVAT